MATSPNRALVAFSSTHSNPSCISIVRVPLVKLAATSPSETESRPQHEPYAEHLALSVLKNMDPNDAYRAYWSQPNVTPDDPGRLIKHVWAILKPAARKLFLGNKPPTSAEENEAQLDVKLDWRTLGLTLGLMKYATPFNLQSSPANVFLRASPFEPVSSRWLVAREMIGLSVSRESFIELGSMILNVEFPLTQEHRTSLRIYQLFPVLTQS